VTGATRDPADVGILADGRDVVVDLVRPGADFPAIVAGPTFGIVPPAVWRDGEDIDTGSSVGSGAYVLDRLTEDEYTLVANEHYWAGPPAISTVHLLTNIGGRSPVAAFEAGDVDYVGIGSYDASWIRFDADLGPQLRLVPSLSLTYVGFTRRPPRRSTTSASARRSDPPWTGPGSSSSAPPVVTSPRSAWSRPASQEAGIGAGSPRTTPAGRASCSPLPAIPAAPGSPR
jgi:ABC-type oligopeptide transport system substrate-binding subunit